MCSISANSRTLHRDTGHAHTSCTHFNWIFELLSSLRSSYALYRDTMPLTLSLCGTKSVFSQTIFQGMMRRHGLGVACGHIKALGFFPFPYQRKICSEGLKGQHALRMLGKILYV